MNLKEFSAEIGVSQTTISRSLSRRGRVSDETREMVLQRMGELGYRPNLNAQRLVSGRANMVVLDVKDMSLFKETFAVELMHGIADALETHSYGLLLGARGERAVHQWATSSAVDGVISIGGEENEALAREITAMGVPCVIIGTRPFHGVKNAASVHIDLHHGARQVAQYLLEMGHTCIGFISSSWVDSVLSDFREELESHGLQLQEPYLVIAGDTARDGEAAAARLLSLPKPPTAIFTRTDELAVGVLRAAHKMNVKVPDQLSVIGHDDVPFAKLTEPLLSTVRVPFMEVGKMASNMLMKLLSSDELQEAQSIETELVIRESVSRLPREP